MSGLIWVQTVCKGYQQTTQGGKELNDPDKNLYAITYENCSYQVYIHVEMNMNSCPVSLDGERLILPSAYSILCVYEQGRLRRDCAESEPSLLVYAKV